MKRSLTVTLLLLAAAVGIKLTEKPKRPNQVPSRTDANAFIEQHKIKHAIADENGTLCVYSDDWYPLADYLLGSKIERDWLDIGGKRVWFEPMANYELDKQILEGN